jgi:hypothetical protein
MTALKISRRSFLQIVRILVLRDSSFLITDYCISEFSYFQLLLIYPMHFPEGSVPKHRSGRLRFPRAITRVLMKDITWLVCDAELITITEDNRSVLL